MPQAAFTRNEIESRRRSLRCLNNGRRVTSDDEAAQFVQERGFVLLAPAKGLHLPSLSEADSRQAWDGYSITDGAWRWKETLPDQRRCAYGKFIRNRGAFLSWDFFGLFYAAQARSGDWSREYREGRLTRPAIQLMETMAEMAPVDSRELWKAVRFGFSGNRPLFVKTLEELQNGYFITVSGGSTEGWSLHRWDLVLRVVPTGLLDGLPDPDEARRIIIRQIARNSVCFRTGEAASILRIPAVLAKNVLKSLAASGHLIEAVVEGEPGVQWTLPEFAACVSFIPN